MFWMAYSYRLWQVAATIDKKSCCRLLYTDGEELGTLIVFAVDAGEYSSFFSFVNGTAAKAVAGFYTSGSEAKNN